MFQRKSVVIEVCAVEEISKVGNIHVERVKKGYPHLENIYFSDVCKDHLDRLVSTCILSF